MGFLFTYSYWNSRIIDDINHRIHQDIHILCFREQLGAQEVFLTVILIFIFGFIFQALYARKGKLSIHCKYNVISSPFKNPDKRGV